MDQGLLVGTGRPFFNRHTASLTRFLQLKPPARGSSQPPPVLVLHGRYGGSLGDMASYDYFILGGPYSVRGRHLCMLCMDDLGTLLGAHPDLSGSPNLVLFVANLSTDAAMCLHNFMALRHLDSCA